MIISRKDRNEFNRLKRVGETCKMAYYDLPLAIDGESAIECWIHHKRTGESIPCNSPIELAFVMNGEDYERRERLPYHDEPSTTSDFMEIAYQEEPNKPVSRSDHDSSWIDDYLPKPSPWRRLMSLCKRFMS